MTPLSSVPERLHVVEPMFRLPTRAPSVGNWPLLPDQPMPLSRVRFSIRCCTNGISTQPVLLPESLWVCPFGGARLLFQMQRTQPALSPDACGEFTRPIYECQTSFADSAMRKTNGWRTLGTSASAIELTGLRVEARPARRSTCAVLRPTTRRRAAKPCPATLAGSHPGDDETHRPVAADRTLDSPADRRDARAN